jgi:hypothetical protein
VKQVFANTTAQREKKFNPHANTPAAIKMKIHENTPAINQSKSRILILNKKYQTGGNISNTQNVERDKMDTPNTPIQTSSLSCIGTGTSITKWWVKPSFMFRFLDMTRSNEDSLCKQITVDVVAMLVGL